MKYFIIAISLCSFCTFCFSQNSINPNHFPEDITRFYQSARTYSDEGNNFKAIRILERILKKYPTYIEAQVLVAELRLKEKQYDLAEIEFEKLVHLEKPLTANTVFQLAKCNWKLNNYKKAYRYLKTIKQQSDYETLDELAVNKLLRDCEFTIERINDTVSFAPINMGENINTYFDEYLPSISADGKIFFYTKKIKRKLIKTKPSKHQFPAWKGKSKLDSKFDEEIYYAKNENGKWKIGQPIKEVNTENSEGGQMIAANGKFLVFTGCYYPNSLGSCDIYYSEYVDSSWSSPTNIGIPINSEKWESQPSISANGDVIYFCSNRSGGRGGSDIWVSYKNSEGKWGEPINLKEINTPYHEKSPFIHPDNKTLYFVSEGHSGFGNTDIFFSKKNVSNVWSKPVNLGFPINTKNNEESIFVSADGLTGYFATDRNFKDKLNIVPSYYTNGILPTKDIFHFQLDKKIRPNPTQCISGNILEYGTNKLLEIDFNIFETASNKKIFEGKSDAKGKFFVCLPIGEKYSLRIENNHYYNYSENIHLTEKRTNDSLLNIYLKEILVVNVDKEIIFLDKVLFAFDSWEIEKSFYSELESLALLLKNKNNVHTTIYGYTDNVGNEHYNQILSKKRAKSIYDFLVNTGLDKNQLNYQGLGAIKEETLKDKEKRRVKLVLKTQQYRN